MKKKEKDKKEEKSSSMALQTSSLAISTFSVHSEVRKIDTLVSLFDLDLNWTYLVVLN